MVATHDRSDWNTAFKGEIIVTSTSGLIFQIAFIYTSLENKMGIEEETDRTLFIRNLDPRVTEELLFELFLQVCFSLVNWR